MSLLLVITFSYISLCNTIHRACLEGKDSYENMKDYMEFLNASLAARVTTSGCKYELWGGGEVMLAEELSGVSNVVQVICALYHTYWGSGLTSEDLV